MFLKAFNTLTVSTLPKCAVCCPGEPGPSLLGQKTKHCWMKIVYKHDLKLIKRLKSLLQKMLPKLSLVFQSKTLMNQNSMVHIYRASLVLVR